MKNKFNHTKKWVFGHKKTSIIIVIVILIVGYWSYGKIFPTNTEIRYTLANVTRGTIITSVGGTGQVEASNQMDINSEVAGNIAYVGVKTGQEVKRWQTIAHIDSSDAERSVTNAQLGLANSKISYQKALSESEVQTRDSALSDTNKAYRDGFAEIADTYLDIPDIVSEVGHIYYTPTHSPYFDDEAVRRDAGAASFAKKSAASVVFDKAKTDFENNFSEYKKISSDPYQKTIINMLEKTSAMTLRLSSALTETYNFIDYIQKVITTVPTQLTTDKNNISSYITILNGHIAKISTALTAIENAKNGIVDVELDLKSAELNVRQVQDSLKSAEEALAKHNISAPFDGLIAKLSIRAGDKVSVGSAITTIITKHMVAKVSLNEIDVAKVKVGQKAKFTFDAVNDLEMTGTVSEVDLVGTVSQGVVTYGVKIDFDTQDDRVKSGMSVSASIITDARPDVLVVPNSAIKSEGNSHYVEIFTPAIKLSIPSAINTPSDYLPTKKIVTIGLSNDTESELLSGLSEGDQIVTKTSTIAKTSATSAPSIFNATGIRTGGTGTGSVRSPTTR